MPVQLQAQLHIQCSGHTCIPGQRPREEEVHRRDHHREVEAAVKIMQIKAVNGEVHHQEEEQDQEEAWDQEEQDHLHQEEEVGEAANHQAAPHRSHQEEQAIQGQLRLRLRDFHSLHVIQIQCHWTDPGNLFQS